MYKEEWERALPLTKRAMEITKKWEFVREGAIKDGDLSQLHIGFWAEMGWQ